MTFRPTKNEANTPVIISNIMRSENMSDPSFAEVTRGPNNNCNGTPSRVSEGQLQDREKELINETSVVQPVFSPAGEAETSKSLPFLGSDLMKVIAEPNNLRKAWFKQLAKDGTLSIVKNGLADPFYHKGKARGIDGKSVLQAFRRFQKKPQLIMSNLKDGSYQPMPVKRVEIPKTPGKTRSLGIPTALDRTIQVAILRILEPLIDPYFLDQNHGFRPARSVYTAAVQVLQHIKSGKAYVVDVDLSKFFDTVSHDLLMEQLRGITSDPILLDLIWKYLKAGVLVNGEIQPTDEGVPQGGPLSPFLANLFLHQFDLELMRRGYAFVRYADDFLIFSSSRRAGSRIMKTITGILEGISLKVNEEKSSVLHEKDLEYLGFEFQDEIRISAKSIDKFKGNVRSYCKRGSNKSVEKNMGPFRMYLNGWLAHFANIQTQDQCRTIHNWLTNYLAKLTSEYRGTGKDPMLNALPIWLKACRSKDWWRQAIDGSPSSLNVVGKVTGSTSDYPIAAL